LKPLERGSQLLLVVFIKKMGSRQTAVKAFFAVCGDIMLDVGKVFFN
jgi:hypothetical protein